MSPLSTTAEAVFSRVADGLGARVSESRSVPVTVLPAGSVPEAVAVLSTLPLFRSARVNV